MVTISACLIVKNEEKVLGRCLDTLKDIADEIVIVDTGSTDSTKKVAGRYTDKIYDFKWIDGFAAARNFSFSKAAMEYIYVADADEMLDEENRERFKRLKASLETDVDIVEMEYGNQLENGTTYNFDVELRPKLYRRLRTFRWIDPIHEVVDCYNKCIKSDIRIIHKPETKHASRDLAIFEKVTAKGLDLNSRLHMMYARELFLGGTLENFEKAFGYFKKIMEEGNRSEDDFTISCCILARYYGLKSDFYNLVKIATKNLRGSISSEICCELGDYYMSGRDYEEAIYWYYTASNLAGAVLCIDCMQFVPNLQTCNCYIALGNISEAKIYLGMAKMYKPDDPGVRASQDMIDKHEKNRTL